jgi:excisionase family DNA binding protein
MVTLYRIYGDSNALLYVGITEHYDQRMRQHSEKAWWSDVRRITTTEFPTTQAAALAEREAITQERPKFNRAHNGAPAASPVIPKARKRVEPRRWLTQLEVAEYLGVTDRTVRNYIARGDLPAHRVRGSRLLRIDLHDVEALLTRIPTAGVTP